MVTSLYIEHLQAYEKRLLLWSEYYRNAFYKTKRARMNEAQIADDLEMCKYKNKVVSEIVRVQNEIKSFQNSQNLIIFKTQN